jgi:hypothetical protein
MRRLTKIERLPPKVREELERMRLEGGKTLRDLEAYLKSKGVKVCAASIAWYFRKLERKMERYLAAHAVARAWTDKFSEKPEGDVGKLLIEMLRVIAFRQLADMSEADPGGAGKPADIAVLARALREMETVSRSIAENESRSRLKGRAGNERKGGDAAPGADLGALEKAKELVRGML